MSLRKGERAQMRFTYANSLGAGTFMYAIRALDSSRLYAELKDAV